MDLQNSLIIELKLSGKEMEKIVKELNENTKKLVKSEMKMNLVRANLVSENSIVTLPNQSMRDAKIEERLQLDPAYSGDYRDYLVLKTENKVLYTKWVLQQELNKNIRVMLMKGGDLEI